MESNKQTAVEWLGNELGITEIVGPEHSGLIRIYAEAKEMERRQSIENKIEILNELLYEGVDQRDLKMILNKIKDLKKL